MDCELAANFISARIDGELSPADGAALDAHLAGCAACRAAAESAELQDAMLSKAFAGRRDVAAAVADRVIGALPARPASIGGRSAWRWAGWVAAAAAGFALAVLIFRPTPAAPTASWPGPTTTSPSSAPNPDELFAAELSLSSGNVFMCPSDRKEWQPIAAGERVTQGAKIRTADAAKCELALPDGSRLRLNGATEVQFNTARDVQLTGGQIWSAVAPEAEAIRVTTGDARVITGEPSAQLDIRRADDVSTLTVVHGAARFDGDGRTATVRTGELLQLPQDTGKLELTCEPVHDAMVVTRWLDDLIVLLPAEHPELATRIDALLSRIAAERAAPTGGVGPIERHVRSRGDLWAAPLARYARARMTSPTDPSQRTVAALLLADLATPACIPDLVELLADSQSDVREQSFVALRRLTGQTLGCSPEQFAATPYNPVPAAIWRQWLVSGRSPIQPKALK